MPTCPLCGAGGAILYAGLRDRFWSAPGLWSFRRCSACGHIWLDPFPTQEDIGKLYSSYFTHGIDRPNPFEGDDLWAQCRRGVISASGYPDLVRDEQERLLGKFARHIPPIREECEQFTQGLEGPPRGLLLDVGCGDGFYLQVMRGLGWNVRGLEPDGHAASVARRRGIDVAETTLEAASLPNDVFQVITMRHVIEHVLDPPRTMRAAHRLLRPGGTLLVATPNAASWGHRHFGSSWFHLDPPRHCHLFTPRNLVACARQANLTVVRWRTTGRGHLVYDGSSSIRRSDRFGLGDPSIRATSRDRLFRLLEEVLVFVRPDGGEEILLQCSKETSGQAVGSHRVTAPSKTLRGEPASF